MEQRFDTCQKLSFLYVSFLKAIMNADAGCYRISGLNTISHYLKIRF